MTHQSIHISYKSIVSECVQLTERGESPAVAFTARPTRKCSSPLTNMAAAVRMRTWSCPTRRVFWLWLVFFVVILNSVNEAVAAPETGLWKTTVVNVSTSAEHTE